MAKTALIVGATGLVGSKLLPLLLESNNYNAVIAVTRKPLDIKHPKLQQHIINFDEIEKHASVFKADDIFCCLGIIIAKAGSQENFYKVDHTYTYKTAQLALKNGASQVVLISSVGADKNSSNFYLRTKGQIENDLVLLGYSKTIIVRPSMLLGDRKEFRLGEIIGKAAMQTFSFLMLGPLQKYKPIQDITVAKAMLNLSQTNTEKVRIAEFDELQSIGNF